MPPKRRVADSDDSDETSSDETTEETSSSEETSSESSDDIPQPQKKPQTQPQTQPQQQRPGEAGAAGGRAVANKPHDVEYTVDNEAHRRTPEDKKKPPPQQQQPPPQQQQQQRPTAAGGGRAGHELLRNNPDDEAIAVDDDRHVRTPPKGVAAGGGQQQQRPGAAGAVKKPTGGLIQNDQHDEFEDVEDDMDDDDEAVTPPTNTLKRPTGAAAAPAGELVRNEHHDEEVAVTPGSSLASPQGSSSNNASPERRLQPAPLGQRGQPQQLAGMKPRGEESSSSSESEDDDDGHKGTGAMMGHQQQQQPSAAPTGPEYNPEEYANLKVSREVRDLFANITSFQPQSQELPCKLIPFIPDFLPSVGDIDTFCKVPRPDGKTDNLGLVIIDEPSSSQSNPAVVKIGLQYTCKKQPNATFIDSVEDAHNRPQVIDKWIADIKGLHYKKPLPTVSYTKPMPDIESLLQIWPPDFEELLASDLQLPPPGIDLDIEQYVRMVCAVVDIPTYTNLIESLHVMFTLYLEFRANQHFQHA